MGVDLVECGCIGRLKRRDDEWYIRLCDEDSYHLTVDTEKIQVPHVVNWNSALVESKLHPDASGSSVWPHPRPFLLTDKNVKFTGGWLITFLVFIPTIS